MKLQKIVDYLDRELDLKGFSEDYSNNGLQAECSSEVRRIVFGVDACQMLFDFAADSKADLVIVHHGLSWGGNPKRLAGIDALRFGTLFRHGISLYAAHLPLDAHPRFGNNAVLCQRIGLENLTDFFPYCGRFIGFRGELPEPRSMAELTELLQNEYPFCPHVLPSTRKTFRRVAVVSGGGGLEAVREAANAKADLLLTGELTHVMYHEAKERNLAVLAMGHFASETTGPRALMSEVEHRFDVDCLFGDFPTEL